MPANNVEIKNKVTVNLLENEEFRETALLLLGRKISNHQAKSLRERANNEALERDSDFFTKKDGDGRLIGLEELKKNPSLEGEECEALFNKMRLFVDQDDYGVCYDFCKPLTTVLFYVNKIMAVRDGESRTKVKACGYEENGLIYPSIEFSAVYSIKGHKSIEVCWEIAFVNGEVRIVKGDLNFDKAKFSELGISANELIQKLLEAEKDNAHGGIGVIGQLSSDVSVLEDAMSLSVSVPGSTMPLRYTQLNPYVAREVHLLTAKQKKTDKAVADPSVLAQMKKVEEKESGLISSEAAVLGRVYRSLEREFKDYSGDSLRRRLMQRFVRYLKRYFDLKRVDVSSLPSLSGDSEHTLLLYALAILQTAAIDEGSPVPSLLIPSEILEEPLKASDLELFFYQFQLNIDDCHDVPKLDILENLEAKVIEEAEAKAREEAESRLMENEAISIIGDKINASFLVDFNRDGINFQRGADSRFLVKLPTMEAAYPLVAGDNDVRLNRFLYFLAFYFKSSKSGTTSVERSRSLFYRAFAVFQAIINVITGKGEGLTAGDKQLLLTFLPSQVEVEQFGELVIELFRLDKLYNSPRGLAKDDEVRYREITPQMVGIVGAFFERLNEKLENSGDRFKTNIFNSVENGSELIAILAKYNQLYHKALFDNLSKEDSNVDIYETKLSDAVSVSSSRFHPEVAMKVFSLVEVLPVGFRDANDFANYLNAFFYLAKLGFLRLENFDASMGSNPDSCQYGFDFEGFSRGILEGVFSFKSGAVITLRGLGECFPSDARSMALCNDELKKQFPDLTLDDIRKKFDAAGMSKYFETSINPDKFYFEFKASISACEPASNIHCVIGSPQDNLISILDELPPPDNLGLVSGFHRGGANVVISQESSERGVRRNLRKSPLKDFVTASFMSFLTSASRVLIGFLGALGQAAGYMFGTAEPVVDERRSPPQNFDSSKTGVFAPDSKQGAPSTGSLFDHPPDDNSQSNKEKTVGDGSFCHDDAVDPLDHQKPTTIKT